MSFVGAVSLILDRAYRPLVIWRSSDFCNDKDFRVRK